MKTFKRRALHVLQRTAMAAFLTLAVWGLSQRLPSILRTPSAVAASASTKPIQTHRVNR